MMISIRTRLLLWMMCGMALLLIVFAVVVYEVLSRSLLDGFDEVLLASARTISASVEKDDAGIKFEMDERQAPEFYRTIKPDYFQLWSEDGTILARSPGLANSGMEQFSGLPDVPVFRAVRLPDGRAGRAVGLVFTPKADEDAKTVVTSKQVSLVVARETDPLDSTGHFIRWLLVAATAGTLVLALLAGSVAVRQGLRPLDALAARIAAVRQDDLSARILAERMPAELIPVIGRLNDLLRRLDDAFRRERAFTADAAHELRTPLAGLLCTLEVTLSQPRTGDDYREATTECLEVTQRMQAVVESLLALARYESGQTALHPEALDVRELIETAWRPLDDKARSRGIEFDPRLPANLKCTADRDVAQMIVGALLANAAEYTNDGGRIEISGIDSAKSMELTITNTGCSLGEEDVEHVFDRFWRGDRSRTHTGIHCGLGLALAQRSASALGGSISACIADERFSVRLILPV